MTMRCCVLITSSSSSSSERKSRRCVVVVAAAGMHVQREECLARSDRQNHSTSSRQHLSNLSDFLNSGEHTALTHNLTPSPRPGQIKSNKWSAQVILCARTTLGRLGLLPSW